MRKSPGRVRKGDPSGLDHGPAGGCDGLRKELSMS